MWEFGRSGSRATKPLETTGHVNRAAGTLADGLLGGKARGPSLRNGNDSFVDKISNVIYLSPLRFGSSHHSGKTSGENTITGRRLCFTRTGRRLLACTRIVTRLLDLQSGRRNPQS